MFLAKTRCDPSKLKNILKLLGFDDTISVENQWFSEGIIASWNKNYMTVCLCRKETQIFHLQVKYQHGTEWMFIEI